ncbi:MAG: hypothetical protein DMG11_28180, partial [Acidobacteria bacterium]
KQPEDFSLYEISASDNRLLWHKDLPAFDGQSPQLGLAPDSFYSYMRATGRLTMFDDRTREPRWTRELPNLDQTVPPITAGNLMIVKSGTDYRALRLSDGSDAWTVPTKTLSTSELTNDRVLAVFDHDERSVAVDIATGKTIVDLPPRKRCFKETSFTLCRRRLSLWPWTWRKVFAGKRRFPGEWHRLAWAPAFMPAPKPEN